MAATGGNPEKICSLRALSGLTHIRSATLEIQIVANLRADRSGRLAEQAQEAELIPNWIQEVFGPAIGDHARVAIGVGALPFNVPVEIEAELELV